MRKQQLCCARLPHKPGRHARGPAQAAAPQGGCVTAPGRNALQRCTDSYAAQGCLAAPVRSARSAAAPNGAASRPLVGRAVAPAQLGACPLLWRTGDQVHG